MRSVWSKQWVKEQTKRYPYHTGICPPPKGQLDRMWAISCPVVKIYSHLAWLGADNTMSLTQTALIVVGRVEKEI